MGSKKSEEQLRMQFEELKTKLYKSYREARDTIIDDLQKTKMELEASKEREKKPSQELDQMEAKAEIQPPPLPKIASPKNISPPMPNYSDRTINVGAVIPLGNYEWLVLEVQNNKVLILSKDVIEERPYNSEYKVVTWKTCTLRKYLNGEFLQKFTGEQQRKIIETSIENNNNPWYGNRWFCIKGGRKTNDRIFLLSIEEVVKYFGDSGQFKRGIPISGYCINDQYNSARKATDARGNAWWWLLRSPGSSSYDVAFICSDGRVHVDGGGVNYSGGIRPALWLHL